MNYNTDAETKEVKDPLVTQFMPAALEIQAAPPPKFGRIIIWLILILFCLLIGWACFGKIDIVAVANGKLVPSGKVKIIQPLENGVVTQIFVDEGQWVEKGTLLVELDGTINNAEQLKLNNVLQGLKDDASRINLLLKKITENVNSQDNPTTHDQLLESMLSEYFAKIQSIDAELTSLNAEKHTIEVSVNRYKKILPITAQRTESLRKMNDSSLVATDQYLQLKQQYIEQQELLAYEQARVMQLESNISAKQQQKWAFSKEFEKHQYEKLEQIEREIRSVEQELAQARQVTRQQQLVSPVDGTVTKLAIATLGGVVTTAQEIMHIVPDGQYLIAEAGLLNKDIGFVSPDQEAEIKLESFPFTTYGVIEATVETISADAIEDENWGLTFPIKVKLKTNQIWAGQRWVELQPGMQATVEIKTGKRRIIEFLLSPVLKGMNEGIRER